MARLATAPDPGTVRLLEASGREYAAIEYDLLPTEEQAIHGRTLREIAGTFVKNENAASGMRTVRVTVLTFSRSK